MTLDQGPVDVGEATTVASAVAAAEHARPGEPASPIPGSHPRPRPPVRTAGARRDVRADVGEWRSCCVG